MSTTASQDIVDLVREYSKKFLLPAEAPRGIFDVVGRGERLSKTGTFDYWERLRRPRKGAVAAGGYTAADPTVTVKSGLPFYVNAVFKMGTGVYRVTAISTDGLTLTITLISGVSDTVAEDAVLKVVTNANVEGGTGAANNRNPEIKRTNTTQIMFDVMSITKSSAGSDQEVGGKEFAKQMADKMAQFRNDTRGMLWSDIYIAAASKGDLAVAAGIPYYVTANGYNPASSTLTAVNLSEFVRYIYDDIGGAPKELWMNPVDRATISTTFDSGFFRRDADSTRRGIVAETFMTTNGIELSINTDVNIPAGEIYALNAKDVDLKPYRDFNVEEVKTLSDSDEYKVVAEVSVEVNPSAQMGKFTF